jgi:hypothetical protein
MLSKTPMLKSKIGTGESKEMKGSSSQADSRLKLRSRSHDAVDSSAAGSGVDVTDSSRCGVAGWPVLDGLSGLGGLGGYLQGSLRWEHRRQAGVRRSQRRLALMQAPQDLRRGGGLPRSIELSD